MSQADKSAPAADAGPMIAQGTDEEPFATNQRHLAGKISFAVAIMAIAYTVFHIYVMNISPLEPWTYRMVHVTGGLFIGFLTYSALTLNPDAPVVARIRSPIEWGLLAVAAIGIAYGAIMVGYAWAGRWFEFAPMPDAFVFGTYGIPLLIGTVAAVAAGWLFSDRNRERVHPADWLLGIAAIAMFGYIIFNVGALRLRAGTGMAQSADFYAALSASSSSLSSPEAFKIGLAAFIVPFMFFYSHELLMQGEWIDIARVVATALLGMYLLSAAVQGYYFGRIGVILRIVLLIAALSMIEGSWYTDLFGLAVAVGLFFFQKRVVSPRTLAKGAD